MKTTYNTNEQGLPQGGPFFVASKNTPKEENKMKNLKTKVIRDTKRDPMELFQVVSSFAANLTGQYIRVDLLRERLDTIGFYKEFYKKTSYNGYSRIFDFGEFSLVTQQSYTRMISLVVAGNKHVNFSGYRLKSAYFTDKQYTSIKGVIIEMRGEHTYIKDIRSYMSSLGEHQELMIRDGNTYMRGFLFNKEKSIFFHIKGMNRVVSAGLVETQVLINRFKQYEGGK